MKDIEKRKTARACARDMGGECIAMRARLISRVISRIFDDCLRPHGLRVSQVSILAAIAGLGLADPLQICRMLEVDPSTLSRNVRRMTTKGWVKPIPKGDRRAHQLELTSEGEEVLVRAFSSWQEAQVKAARFLGEESTARLKKISEDLWAKRQI